MAWTAKGRQLTRSHQRNQIALAAKRDAWFRKHYETLNLDDLSGTFAHWYAPVQAQMGRGFVQSQEMAKRYVDQFASAEKFNLTVPSSYTPPGMDVGLAREALWVTGPIQIKKKIGRGMSPQTAAATTFNKMVGAVQEQILAGGRMLITDVSKYSGKAGRWRRVTNSSKPCAFCAMLAGRGPVYTRETAKFEAHDYCFCTPEIVVGDWEPTMDEALWRHAYDQAALQADAAGELRVAPSVAKKGQQEDNILWRMRRDFPTLFSDGVFPKQ